MAEGEDGAESEQLVDSAVAARHARLDWVEHIPLLSAVGLTVLVALRLVRVSRGSGETALALLSYSGTANVAIAILMQTLPTLLAGFTVGLIVSARKDGISIPDWAVLGLLLSLLVVPWKVLVGVLAFGAVDYAFNVLPKRRAERRGKNPPTGADRPVIYGMYLLLLVLGPDTVCLPVEVVSTDSEVVVGYVLATGDGELTVLRHDDRTVQHLDATSVRSRQFCTTTEEGWQWSTESAMDLLTTRGKQPSYQKCEVAGSVP